jgi:signal peptidase
VIVFEAEEIQGGGLTTHRVVGETEQGFITKGDANPFVDQDDQEPPVKRAQVVAEAWQVGGGVVAIPHLGTVVTETRTILATVQRALATTLGTNAVLGPQGLAYLIFAVSLAWYLVAAWRSRGRREQKRTKSRESGLDSRVVVGLFTLLLVVGATAAMTVPAGTQEFGVVSAEFDSDRPDVVPAGESKQRTLAVGNSGFVPVTVFLDPASEGVDVQPRELSVGAGSVTNATLTLQAPPETGYYRRFVTEHRYLALLPPGAIRGLYSIHPWAPVVAIDALIAVPFYFVTMWFVGTGRIRRRSRDSPGSITGKIRGFVGGRRR